MSLSTKKIIIVLPVYNEEKVLQENTLKVYNFCQENLVNYDWQILIANNGSTDKTEEIAQKLTQDFLRISYFYLKEPGRGMALKKAWSKYKADVYVYMDIDLATDLKHLPFLISTIDEEQFDLSTGSRLVRGAHVKRSILRDLTSKVYNLLLKIFFLKYNIKDSQCGFKAISNKTKEKILPSIKNNKWFFDTELLVRSFYNGYKIKEIPVEWREERFIKRKSTVKMMQTIWDDIKEIFRLKKELLFKK